MNRDIKRIFLILLVCVCTAFGQTAVAAAKVETGVKTETNPEKSITRIAQPRLVVNPPFLPQRAAAQLATAAEFTVFNAFSFTDRVEESGIGFQHRAVEDAAVFRPG